MWCSSRATIGCRIYEINGAIVNNTVLLFKVIPLTGFLSTFIDSLNWKVLKSKYLHGVKKANTHTRVKNTAMQRPVRRRFVKRVTCVSVNPGAWQSGGARHGEENGLNTLLIGSPPTPRRAPNTAAAEEKREDPSLTQMTSVRGRGLFPLMLSSNVVSYQIN